MATRILTWHLTDWRGGDERMGPSYYMEADYVPVAVRINAETAPHIEDAVFDIKDDGVSIFANRAVTYTRILSSSKPAFVNGMTVTSGHEVTTDPAKTTAVLSLGDNNETAAEEFKEDLLIEAGSWISCNVLATGEGRNFSVHLELMRVSEEQEED